MPPRKYKFNALTGERDRVDNDGYVAKEGDTMTGTLVINPATDENALEIQSGKWVVLDG